MVGMGGTKTYISSWGYVDEDGVAVKAVDSKFRLWSLSGKTGHRLALIALPKTLGVEEAWLIGIPVIEAIEETESGE